MYCPLIYLMRVSLFFCTDRILFETGVVCNGALMRLMADPMWLIGAGISDQDAMKGLLLTGKMSDSQYRRLVALNVAQYLKMLNLSPLEKRNSEMLASWLFSGCNTWIRVAGDNNIPTVKVTSKKLKDFIAEFPKDEHGHYNHEDALFKSAVNGLISEQDFMDWYVICRFSDAIVPPVSSGFPKFTSVHTSVLASVLRAKPQLYDLSVDRKVRDFQYCFSTSYSSSPLFPFSPAPYSLVLHFPLTPLIPCPCSDITPDWRRTDLR